MKSPLLLTIPLLPTIFATPTPAPSIFNAHAHAPAFILAGDSTTAIQSSNGGGWGNGFLTFLRGPAHGVNKGHNGATTQSFVDGGDWDVVKGLVAEYRGKDRGAQVYVTIQFGHNDQKNTSGVTLDEYRENLIGFTRDVRRLGGTPLLLTPLTRRAFTAPHTATDSLHDQRLATISAARVSRTAYLDLNAASLAYVDAIGEAAAHAYNLNAADNTHLNDWGSVVFGRLVADLLLAREPGLGRWVVANETMSALIREGMPA
ncbi:SGNH hydrolase-type esterase domain-containing protein [Nemania serpens]|nr:SGNH hydrolase-type esterase domain-containing protein [Nemania serpens]